MLYDKIPELSPNDMERIAALMHYLYERGDRWTTMEQVTDSVTQYPAYFLTKNYHNSATRRLLTKDIEYINATDVFDRIIISGSKGVKIANEEELGEWLQVEFKEVFKKLKRLRHMARKATHDQQISLEGKIREIFLKEG